MSNDRTAVLQRVAQEETERFIDQNFGGLDLSGCVSLLTPPSEESQLPDERFAPLDDRGLGLGSRALKQGIEELVNDVEVQEQVAKETGNPELLQNLQNSRAEALVREFMRKNPSYHRCLENFDRLVQTVAYNALGWLEDEATAEEAQEELIRQGLFTIENLTAAFHALSRAGVLEVKPGQPRTLTEHQKRMIAMEAAGGNVESAIARYLQFRLPEQVADEVKELFGIDEVLDRLADPELKQIVAEAVFFTWEHSRCDYSPTPERRRALREYVGGRIPTVRLLDAAWARIQKDESDAMRSSLVQQFEQEQPSHAAPDLEGLSDAEVDRLYHQTLRQFATETKRV